MKLVLFGTLPNGSYGAQMGNDDVIMTLLLQLNFLTQQIMQIY
jgi:hypothetical protein